MTLCAAVNLGDQTILLVADTIVTSSSPTTELIGVAESGEVLARGAEVVGTTSRGESLQPISGGSGVRYHSEAACKITRLALDTFVGFAGDEELCVSLAETLNSRPLVLRPQELPSFLRRVAAEVASRRGFPALTAADALFCIGMLDVGRTDQRRPLLLRCEFRVTRGGAFVRVRSVARNVVCAIGSGAELVPSDAPSNYYASRPPPEAVCLFGNWFSQQVRRQLRNEAIGVGGAFLGGAVALTGGESGFMPDLIELFISSSGRARVLAKTICREPGFIVRDFMRDTTTVFPLMDRARRLTEHEAAQLIDRMRRTDLRELNGNCLIVENDAEGLPIRRGVYSCFSAQGFSNIVGFSRPGGVSHVAFAIPGIPPFSVPADFGEPMTVVPRT